MMGSFIIAPMAHARFHSSPSRTSNRSRSHYPPTMARSALPTMEQFLIEPFSRVANYDGLVRVLNYALHLHQQHQIKSSNDPSDEVVIIGPSGAVSPCLAEENKENEISIEPASSSEISAVPRQPTSAPGDRRLVCGSQQPNIMLMNKRQLVATLNSVLLGEVRSNVVERVHEFTDSAYTKHEQREAILLLLYCIKLHLNKLVKLIYRLCRRISSVNELTLSQLRQLASELCDLCDELEYELQTGVIEQSDELDRCNTQLSLLKQIKHNSLVGDVAKTDRACSEFYEQSEQLIEVCKMFNQVAPTHRMKIITKTLAIWFDLNLDRLLDSAKCLSENPRSKEAKDCSWAYIQVWRSFYDDFCQIARQIAYLTHSQYHSERAGRVASIRDQLLVGRQTTIPKHHQDITLSEAAGHLELAGTNLREHATSESHRDREPQSSSSLTQDYSYQSLNVADAFSDIADSPHSLDHYHGFGANYHRHAHLHLSDQSGLVDPQTTSASRLQSSANSSRHYANEHQLQQQTELENQQIATTRLHQPDPTLVHEEQCNIDGRYDHTCQPNSFIANGAANYSLEACPTPSMSTLHVRRNPYSPSVIGADPVTLRQIQPLQHQQQQLNNVPDAMSARGPPPQARRAVTIDEAPVILDHTSMGSTAAIADHRSAAAIGATGRHGCGNKARVRQQAVVPSNVGTNGALEPMKDPIGNLSDNLMTNDESEDADQLGGSNIDQQSSITDADKWSDSDADAIVRGAKETAQMALSMYQFTKGEGDLNTTQDLFTQAELFAEEANDLYKEVRCFSYKVPAGDLKKELLSELSAIPALVQQLQFIVKNPTVGRPATFAKVDCVIRETKTLMEAVNRVVTATLSCRQHYNMAIASMRKRTRTLSPSYRGDKGFEFENYTPSRQSAIAGRHGPGAGGGGMGSEPDI